MASVIILLRVLISAILSGLIGIEREIHGCAAGLRTHILVSVGATLFMLTSIFVSMTYGSVGDSDPSRIAANVVTGIGFLGAGAIIRYGASIRGLTTAASIWAAAAVGLAVGAGMYSGGVITTLVVLAVLILSRLEERMRLKQYGRKLVVTIESGSGITKEEIRGIIQAFGGRVKKMHTSDEDEGAFQKIIFDMIISNIYHKDLITEIDELRGVKKVKWHRGK